MIDFGLVYGLQRGYKMQIFTPTQLPHVETVSNSSHYILITLILVCVGFTFGIAGVILHQNRFDKEKSLELKPTKFASLTGVFSALLIAAAAIVLIVGFATDINSKQKAFADSWNKTKTENIVVLQSWLKTNYAIEATDSDANKLLADDSVLVESQNEVISVSLIAYQGGYVLVQSANTKVVPQLNGVRNG